MSGEVRVAAYRVVVDGARNQGTWPADQHWAAVNYARLQLSFGHRHARVVAIDAAGREWTYWDSIDRERGAGEAPGGG